MGVQELAGVVELVELVLELVELVLVLVVLVLELVERDLQLVGGHWVGAKLLINPFPCLQLPCVE